MKNRSRIPYLIFIAFVTLSLAACATKEAIAPEDIEKQAFEDLRTKVREIINDSVHQTKIITLVDQLQVDFNSMRNSLVTRKSKLRELFADYDAPREKFDKQIALYDTHIKSNRKQFGDSRRVLVETMTPDEWSAVNKTESKAMNTLIKSLQSI